MGSFSVVQTAGGTASCTGISTSTSDYSNDYWTTLVYVYGACYLSATPNAGWSFVRWERRSREVADEHRPADPNGEWDEYTDHREKDWCAWKYWSSNQNESVDGHLLYNEQRNTDGGYYVLEEWYEFRAIFKQDGTEFTVSVSASPQNGGAVNGGGRYVSGATCMITATPANGYTFLRWELSSGDTVKNASHSFTVAGDTAATAYFKQQSGKLLHGAGGTLIFGRSGGLLYDG